MCELLIQNVDHVDAGDPIQNSKLYKRGDVIVAADDGHAWGVSEVANPDWTVVKLPLVPFDVGQAMLGPELDTDPTNPSATLQRRAFRVDLDNLPADPSGLTAEEFLVLKLRKAPTPDPNRTV